MGSTPSRVSIGWCTGWKRGFAVYQALIQPDTAFSFGDTPGLADICLIPQLYNAQRWGVDLSPFSRLTDIETTCLALPAFDAGATRKPTRCGVTNAMPLQASWVDSANSPDTDFPLMNLPCGVFSIGEAEPRCGVAIGDRIFDVTRAEEDGLISGDDDPVFDVPFWNDFMELGPEAWAALRTRLTELLTEGAEPLPDYLVNQADAKLHMPFAVAEYTDFYAGKHHANQRRHDVSRCRERAAAKLAVDPDRL